VNIGADMSIKSELLASVAAAKVENDPYSYFYMPKVFSEQNYDTILNNLPATDVYEQFEHPDAKGEYGSTRLRIKVKEKLDVLHPVFKELHEVCTSEDFREVLFNKLGAGILSRFPSLDKTNSSPHVFLFRDLQGYKIRPHPDAASKIVTFQLYLPTDNEHASVGTIVYKSRIDRNHDMWFDKYTQFPFVRNSGYSFAVTKNSWHGVEEVDTKDSFIRNSLMVIFYANGKEYK
jgi:hypothetical protein